ncbi:MAG: rimM [Nocardioidaceae bacterium]|nr:rimM [Nocardioidaceae bacterium]
MNEVEVCVGRISKAHGVRGEVAVEVRTDEPDKRFTVGARLALRGKHPGLPATVTIATIRQHQDRLLLTLDEVPDRNAAEAARGALLYVDLPTDEVPDDPEVFFDHQLVGLGAEDTDGTGLGTVKEVLHHGGQDLLVIEAEGREVLVPFVEALVPEVDLAGGRLVVADRPGLVSGEAEEARS